MIVTGSFDGKIRFWQYQSHKNIAHPQAFLTIEAHNSPVNAIQFSGDYQNLFSGSAAGTIKVWKQELTDDEISYRLLRTIETLRGTPIYSFSFHPNGRKILVRTSQGIHSFDTRIFRLVSQYLIPSTYVQKQDYLSAYRASDQTNSSPQAEFFLKATYSACGEYVFAGTNDGKVAIWKSETGSFIKLYSRENLASWQNSGPITDISFHPLDHSIAFAVWGQSEPIRVYTYDEKQPDFAA